MAILATGNSFSTGDQVTAAALNAAVNSATFDTGAVDGSTTKLSGGAIIVRDGGVTVAKLASTTGSGSDVVLSTSPTLVTPVIGVATGTSLTVSGVLKSTGATSGIGYATGAGGTVTQGAGSGKATGVTLNKICGRITMNNASLAANTSVGFILTNSNLASGDMIVLNLISAGLTTGNYLYWADTVGVGSCYIYIRNISGGPLSEAVQIGFVIIKGVIT